MKVKKIIDIIERSIRNIMIIEKDCDNFTMEDMNNIYDCISTLKKSYSDATVNEAYLPCIIDTLERLTPLAIGKINAPGLHINVRRTRMHDTVYIEISRELQMSGIVIAITPSQCHMEIKKVRVVENQDTSTVTVFYFNVEKMRMSIYQYDNANVMSAKYPEDVDKIYLLDHISVLS